MSLLFTQVKSQVTTRQAAERYGVQVNHSGMACCPFHDDRHPSMKIDERVYCFGCHTTGDVIDFTARLFSLPLYDATKKLAMISTFSRCRRVKARRSRSCPLP